MKVKRTYFEVILGIYRVSCYMLKFRYNKNNFLTFFGYVLEVFETKIGFDFFGGSESYVLACCFYFYQFSLWHCHSLSSINGFNSSLVLLAKLLKLKCV